MSANSKNEDQWFNENEEKLIRAAKDRHQREKEERKKQNDDELKKLHWLKCLKCGHDMNQVNIKSIEVDKCSNCEGVFFDPGELDELMLIENHKKKSFFQKLVEPVFN